MMKDGFVGALMRQKHLPLPIVFRETVDEGIGQMMCAFLNGGGGWIVVGVNGNKEFVGVETNSVSEIQNMIVSSIVPMPLIYVQEEEIEGKFVVLITIMQGNIPPYSFKGRYFVVSNGEAVCPDADRMAMLFRDSSKVRSLWEADDCVLADDSCLDEELMQEVYDVGLKRGRLRPGNVGLHDIMSELQLFSVSTVTNGAVALFARDTGRLLPQLKIRIQLMLKGKASAGYEDTFFIEGNIFYCLEQTLDYFKNRLPNVSRFYSDRSGRDDGLLYPLDVIDEAVSNALIHRDYTNRADEVRIFVYSDRMEISNSGEMPGNLVKAKKKIVPHGSVLRNPRMAEMFYIAGKMEKTGRGLQLISDRMKELGCRLPEWTVGNGVTVLTVYSISNKKELNERILTFVRDNKGRVFTKEEYMDAFEKKLSKGTAQNDILMMRNAGLVMVLGNGPATRYKIV